MKNMGNDKFVVMDATDFMVVGGFGNLKGNLELLKYDPKEIEEMLRENNSKDDDIRLVKSLLESLYELKEKNETLKTQRDRWKRRSHKLAIKCDKTTISNREIFKEITNCCENCKSHECCPEEECAIFNIEKILSK